MAEKQVELEAPVLAPRLLRKLHTVLTVLRAEVHGEQDLLQRLWYVSRAQFRSAKWMKCCDGLRRRLQRLTGYEQRELRGHRRHQVHQRGTRGSHGLLDQTIESTARLYCSLWSSSSFRPTDTRLARFPFPPDSKPPVEMVFLHLLLSLRLLYLTIEVQQRARAAFMLLKAHINTPPAPTFAPLALTLLAICAKVERLCDSNPAQDSKIGGSRPAFLHLSQVYTCLRAEALTIPASDRNRQYPPSPSCPPKDLSRCPGALRNLINSATCHTKAASLHLVPITLDRRPSHCSKRRREEDDERSLPTLPKRLKGLIE